MSIDIATLNQGNFAAAINAEVAAAIKHIADKDTSPKDQRVVTVKITLKPVPGNDTVHADISVDSKLGGHHRGSATSLQMNCNGTATELQTAIDFDAFHAEGRALVRDFNENADDVLAAQIAAQAAREMAEEAVDPETGEVTTKRRKLSSVAAKTIGAIQ